MSLLTMLDIAKMNGSDAVVGLIDEVSKAHPELTGMVTFLGSSRQIPNVGASRTINGQQYKTLVRTGLPSVSFRNANEGQARTKSTYENRLVETYIMNPRWGADKAVADKHEDGPEAVLAEEASAHTEAAMDTACKVFYYGTDATFGDAKGFPGLLQCYDSATLEVDAGGTTASTGSSVWGVRFGPQHVQWVFGNMGSFDLSDVDLRDLDDGAGNEYTGYHQELWVYPGLQCKNNRAVGRIKKLTEDSGKGLTDDLVSTFLAKFSLKERPDVLFMSRRSLKQLKNSRTATRTDGDVAPWPDESNGIPIAVTEHIVDNESLTL